MAKALLVAFRDPTRRSITEDHVRTLAKALAPDNITPREPWILSDEHDLLAVFQPSSAVPMHEGSLCLGHMLSPEGEWWKVGADIPEGSFALYRRNARQIELVTDILGSRSIFYVKTPDLFIASPSQRAIVSCLGSYESSITALAWLLSAGNTGYGNSWDRRISLLPPDSRLIFDRAAWSLTVQSNPVVFEAIDRPEVEAKAAMSKAVDSSVARINNDLDKWRFLLSGGTDSRLILFTIKDRGVKALTWGMARDAVTNNTDAWIAAQLTKYYKLPHEFRPLDAPVEEALETILNRYVALCESRVDNFTGYLDGMRIYKEFYEEGIEGIIRGEVAYDYRACSDELGARGPIEMVMFSDYGNLSGTWLKRFEFQHIAPDLERRPNETFTTWGHRLKQLYTTPIRFGGLNELKTWFVEIINPLIVRSIILESRRLTDALRADRRVHNEIVTERSPNIGFAHQITPAERKPDLLRTEPYVKLMRETLDAEDARRLLSDELVDMLLGKLTVRHASEPLLRRRIRRWLSGKLPKGFKKRVRNVISPPTGKLQMDFYFLAFRAYMAVKMDRLLRADAQRLKTTHEAVRMNLKLKTD